MFFPSGVVEDFFFAKKVSWKIKEAIAEFRQVHAISYFGSALLLASLLPRFAGGQGTDPFFLLRVAFGRPPWRSWQSVFR
jgi:hypothetical protein